MHTFDLFGFCLPDVMTLVLLDKILYNVHNNGNINIDWTALFDRGALKLFDYALMTCDTLVKQSRVGVRR